MKTGQIILLTLLDILILIPIFKMAILENRYVKKPNGSGLIIGICAMFSLALLSLGYGLLSYEQNERRIEDKRNAAIHTPMDSIVTHRVDSIKLVLINKIKE